MSVVNRNAYDTCACGRRKTAVSKRCWDCHSDAQRLLERLVRIVTNECIEWPRARSRGTGYGTVTFNGARTTAHRAAYECVNGTIPSGMHVLHRCDNRPCVNVRHLFLGTNDDNIADKIAKGRQSRGEQAHAARLTEASVRSIRARAAVGETRDALAVKFGVSRQAINDVVWRRTWSHVQ